MVKFLVVGDFHGKFPKNLKNEIKQENPDIILSPGDFCGNERWGKLFFKYAYHKEESEIPSKIKKELESLKKKATQDGLKVFKILKSLEEETYSIMGNWDPAPFGVDISYSSNKKNYLSFKKFKKEQTKRFQLIDFEIREFKEFILIGGVSSTHPGKIDKNSLNKIIKNADSKRQGKKFSNAKMKNYSFRKKRYEELFKKANSIDKPKIFLTHNAPFNTKLDKIKFGIQKGKHYGSYLERLMIKKFKPDLVITGHMHENFGKDKIGKSLILNSGTAMENNYITFEFDDKTKKIKNVKFHN
jgi:Icc-related predicted phosphoesterase